MILHPMFQGILRFPSGDWLEGTFAGMWNEGLKVNGTFNRADSPPARPSVWSSTALKPPSRSVYSKIRL